MMIRSILVLASILVLISPEFILAQGPPPPGGVRIQERKQNGPPDTPDMSLSKKVLQTVAKHIEGKLPNLNTGMVIQKVKNDLGLSNGRK